MKIIKRNGAEAVFDRSKIESAVRRANTSVQESDRLNGTASLLKDLGADVRVEGESLIICGTGRLAGGRARVLGDHRLAMAAAVAACSCDAEVVIDEPACVAKSFPDFWTQLEALEVLR